MLTTIGNSLENGVAGKYDLHIKPILQEAWQKTKGFKKKFWGALGFVVLVFLAISVIESAITTLLAMAAPSSHLDKNVEAIFNIVNGFVLAPLYAGLFLIGIRWVTGQTIRASLVFRGWQVPKLFWNLILTIFILDVLVFLIAFVFILGVLLFLSHALLLKILGGIICVIAVLFLIYLFVAYTLTQLLAIERELTAWRSFLISIRAITQHWFKVFAVCLVILLLSMVGFLTLGIGLIWLLPMIFNIYGIIYRDIVGAQVRPLEEICVTIQH